MLDSIKSWMSTLAGISLVAICNNSEAAPASVSDANGVVLGTLAAHDSTGVQFVTAKGYVARVVVYRTSQASPAEGSLTSIFGVYSTWASSDCSGQRLAETAVTGRVEATKEAVYYVPANAVAVTIHAGQAYSYRNDAPGAVCQQSTMSADKVYVPALPNDPAVTGLPNGPFPIPIRVSLTDPIYRDGFQLPV